MVFSPELSVESYPLAERAVVTALYAAVDEATAPVIKAAVDEEFGPIASLVPASASAYMKDEMRSSWLKEHYIKVVSRVLRTRPQTPAGAGVWVFEPEVPLAVLKGKDRARAQSVYALVARANRGLDCTEGGSGMGCVPT